MGAEGTLRSGSYGQTAGKDGGERCSEKRDAWGRDCKIGAGMAALVAFLTVGGAAFWFLLVVWIQLMR